MLAKKKTVQLITSVLIQILPISFKILIEQKALLIRIVRFLRFIIKFSLHKSSITIVCTSLILKKISITYYKS